jgi:hypothetical protein
MTSPFTTAVLYTVEWLQPRPLRAVPNHCGLHAEGPANTLGVQPTAPDDTKSLSWTPAGEVAAFLEAGAARDAVAADLAADVACLAVAGLAAVTDAAALPAMSPAVDRSAPALAIATVAQRCFLIFLFPSTGPPLETSQHPEWVTATAK